MGLDRWFSSGDWNEVGIHLVESSHNNINTDSKPIVCCTIKYVALMLVPSVILYYQANKPGFINALSHQTMSYLN